MEGGTLPPYILHPFSMEYRIWLYLTCAAAAWTGEAQTDVRPCLTLGQWPAHCLLGCSSLCT